MKDEEIKKGAAPGYLEELAGRLFRERIHTLPVQNGLSSVALDGRSVGAVAENGDMYQRRGDLDTPEAKDLYFRVLNISREVSEYRKEMERAPVLEAEGLNEPYKLLVAVWKWLRCTVCHLEQNLRPNRRDTGALLWELLPGSQAGFRSSCRSGAKSRKGYWVVAGSGILTHTITNKRLAQAG